MTRRGWAALAVAGVLLALPAGASAKLVPLGPGCETSADSTSNGPIR